MPSSLFVSAIIAAGGRGRRFGGAVPKQLLPVEGRSALERSVALFLTHPEVHEIVVEIVRDHADLPVAQEALSLAISAALEAFAAAKDDAKGQAAQRTRLEGYANYAGKNWSDKAVGDDARMGLAQVCLSSGDVEAALKHLGEVPSQSKRFPTALHVLGQLRWKQYLEAKKADDAEARAAESRWLELRAAMALARLWHRVGREEPARDLLTPIVEGFTEGWETADLEAARELLEEMEAA